MNVKSLERVAATLHKSPVKIKASEMCDGTNVEISLDFDCLKLLYSR